MDRLEAMSILVTIADQGSFSAASRVMKMPLATVSRKIADLEALLGVRLLTRTTRKLTLTDAGASYVSAARRILEQVDEIEREAAGEFVVPRGELVLTAPLLFGRLHVLPVVTEFLAMFPEINVRLHLGDRNLDLIEDHVDMAVRIGHLPDSTMIATCIGDMRTVTCASPRFLASHGIPKAPSDLDDYACITITTPMPVPEWRFFSAASQRTFDVSITPRLQVTTPEAALDAAVQGVGLVRLLYYQAEQALAENALQIVLRDYELAPVPVSLLHISRVRMPLKMRRFLDFAAPRLKAALKKKP